MQCCLGEKRDPKYVRYLKRKGRKKLTTGRRGTLGRFDKDKNSEGNGYGATGTQKRHMGAEKKEIPTQRDLKSRTLGTGGWGLFKMKKTVDSVARGQTGCNPKLNRMGLENREKNLS